MTKKTILGISLALVMLCGSIPLGFSEPLRVQLESGLETNQIQCDNTSHVLVLRTNGKLACISEKSAERMNWEIIGVSTQIIQETTTQKSDSENIQQVLTDKVMKNDITKISDKQLSITNIGKSSNSTFQGELGSYEPFWPQHTLSFPEEVRVGEPFDVVLDYQFAMPTIDDDVNGVEFEVWEELDGKCPVEQCGDYSIFIHHPTYVNLLNRSDYISEGEGTDTNYLPHRTFEGGVVQPPYNNTAPQQETFTFVINRPTVDYMLGEIYVTYTPSSDERIYFYVAPDNVVHLSEDPITGLTSALGTTLVEDLHLQEPVNDPGLFQKDPPLSEIPYLAEFFKEFYPDGDIETELRNSNITQAFIDKFFEANPDLRAQSFIPSAYWILPQAFGAPPSFSSVSGTLKYTNPDGNLITLPNTKVCAYDSEGSTLTPLMNGRTHVCKITDSNGNFRLGVPRTDPNGAGNTDLLLRAYAENNNFVIYKNNNNNIHTVTSVTPKTLSNSGVYNYGDFTLPSGTHTSKAFWVITELEPIKDWYTRNVSYTPPKSYIIWDPQRCSGAGVDPTSKSMTLEHTYKVLSDRNVLCDSVISPLSNIDTLAHEYAHMQFYRQYDSKNSDYPNYELREHDRLTIHSPVHASPTGTTWVEGWAFFMATAYSGSPIFQPSYMVGQWNFETRTHTETQDSKFAGKSFVDGIEGEGNVAAVLYDMIDTTNESGDDQSNQLRNIWNIMRDNKETGESVIASDFMEFVDDWNDSNLGNLNNILSLNTLPAPSSCIPETSSGFVFYDHFTCDLSKWTESGGNQRWDVKIPDERQIPRMSSDNTVANAANCDTDCNLTMTDSINLSGYNTATLQFWRYLDSSLDGNEGLRLEISTDGTNWTELNKWTKRTGHANDQWTKESVNLSSYLSNDVKIRFVALASSSYEEIEIDDVTITGSRSSGGGGGINPPPQTAPTFVSINDIAINEGDTTTITARATDTNGDTIRYSLSSSQSWVSINSNSGTITISAPSELSSTNYSVTVKATDNDGYDTESFRINITEINQSPILSDIGNKSVKEESTLSFRLSSSDSDRPSQTLRYSMSNAPTGSSINSSTGLFSWTPNITQSGTYDVTFKVTDNGSPAKSDSETITITVINKAPTIPQVPPVLSSVSDVTINEGDTKSFAVSATDDNNDTITYSLSNSPSWVTISGDIVTITAPTELSDTVYSGTILATDNDGYDSESFTITVNEVNESPTLDNISDKSIQETSTISFRITASDSDIPAQSLSFLMDDYPEGAVISSSTGLFSWTPNHSQVGTHSIIFTVTDDGFPISSDSQNVEFTVTAIPVTASQQTNYYVNQPYTFTCDNTETFGYQLIVVNTIHGYVPVNPTSDPSIKNTITFTPTELGEYQHECYDLIWGPDNSPIVDIFSFNVIEGSEYSPIDSSDTIPYTTGMPLSATITTQSVTVSNELFTFSGTSTNAVEVALYIEGEFNRSIVYPDSSGDWSFDVILDEGENALGVVVTKPGQMFSPDDIIVILLPE